MASAAGGQTAVFGAARPQPQPFIRNSSLGSFIEWVATQVFVWPACYVRNPPME
jgi:hypothetical protein